MIDASLDGQPVGDSTQIMAALFTARDMRVDA